MVIQMVWLLNMVVEPEAEQVMLGVMAVVHYLQHRVEVVVVEMLAVVQEELINPILMVEAE